MDGDVVAGPGIVGIKSFVKRFYIIVKPGPGHALDRHDADSVLVAELEGFLGVKGCFLQSQRHGAHLDLPQLREFFPYDLEPGRNYEIGFVVRLAFLDAAVAPANPCGDAAEHTCL